MLKFLDGHMLGTVSHAGATAADANAGGGGGGNQAAAAAAAAAGANSNAADAVANGNGPWAFPTEKAFAEYLPEKFKTLPNFRDIKSFDGLLDTFVSQQKLVGLDKSRLLVAPKDDNDNEALSTIYKSLGQPEKPDGYKVPPPAEGKVYSDSDKAFQAAVLPLLHEVGLTQRQVAALVPKWNALQEAAAGADEQKTKDAIAAADKALTSEWGAAKATKVQEGKDATAWLDKELKLNGALTQALERTDKDGNRLGNDPALLKLFAYFGAQMKEDGLIGKGGAQGQTQYSPAEAKQQIAALQADEKFIAAYTKKDHPGHADAVERMRLLYEAANPSEASQEG